jgi:transcriptional regulator with XRE-family HTH domain
MAKKIHSNTEELRQEFAHQLSCAIKNVSKNVAAAKLGISRQMLYLYLKGKATPGGEVIEKACAEWKLTLTIKGNPFTGGAFASDANTRKEGTEPQQLSLLHLLDKLRNDQVEARIVSRKGGVFLLSLQIKEVA